MYPTTRRAVAAAGVIQVDEVGEKRVASCFLFGVLFLFGILLPGRCGTQLLWWARPSTAACPRGFDAPCDHVSAAARSQALVALASGRDPSRHVAGALCARHDPQLGGEQRQRACAS